MGQVNVTINGKHYRMACDDGEETHLTALSELLNGAIDALRERFGEIGDQRLTVMAAITFADQSAEAARRVAHLEQQIADSERARAAALERESAERARAAGAIQAVAERIESIAGKVGGAAGAKGNGA